jgi:hypothetical protein
MPNTVRLHFGLSQRRSIEPSSKRMSVGYLPSPYALIAAVAHDKAVGSAALFLPGKSPSANRAPARPKIVS